MEKCDLCKKDRKGFDGCIWYSGEKATYLCKGCYMAWFKTEKRKYLKKKYNDTKPKTREWYKMCSQEQKAFDRWFAKTSLNEGGKK